MYKTPKLAHQSHVECQCGSEKKRMLLRQQIRDAYFVHGWSRRRIAQTYRVSSHTVYRWTISSDQDVTSDRRGWPPGMRRIHTMETESRIRALHAALCADPHAFFTGASAIEQAWLQQYDDPAPPLRTIGRMLKELGLSVPRTKGRGKGAAAHLHYPEHSIYTLLKGRVLEADFIGKKFLVGHAEPLNFFSIGAKKAPKIRYFERVQAESSTALTGALSRFMANYEIPDFVKFDNSPAMIGSNWIPRTISRTARWLLKQRIVPIYAVPKRPFSQASIEGSNSLFSKRFWRARQFESLAQVDEELAWFNEAIRQYHQYTPPPKRSRKRKFHPRMYFLRQVDQHPEVENAGCIGVLNERIVLPTAYIKYFVLAEWDLKSEQLTVYFEREKESVPIHTEPFLINGEKPK